jgi:hypothetical protein
LVPVIIQSEPCLPNGCTHTTCCTSNVLPVSATVSSLPDPSEHLLTD